MNSTRLHIHDFVIIKLSSFLCGKPLKQRSLGKLFSKRNKSEGNDNQNYAKWIFWNLVSG